MRILFYEFYGYKFGIVVRFFLILLLCNIALEGCNSDKRNSTVKRFPKDNLQKKLALIEDYRSKENNSYDSILYFKLDSVEINCLKLLYGVYGEEYVTDVDMKKSVTIGECNIRLYKFDYKSRERRMITFEIFWSDSLPVNAGFDFRNIGRKMSTFEIDITKKELISASVGDESRMLINDFIELFNERIQRNEFKEYLQNFQNNIHPKFKQLLMNNNLIDSSNVKVPGFSVILRKPNK